MMDYDFLAQISNTLNMEILLEDLQELPRHYEDRVQQLIENLTQLSENDPAWFFRDLLVLTFNYVILLEDIRQRKIDEKARKDYLSAKYDVNKLSKQEVQLYQEIQENMNGGLGK